MKRIQVLAIAISMLISASCRAGAATAWFFQGQCYDARVKWGTLDEDLRDEQGDPIHCLRAVLLELRNGRKLVNFITGRGILGFAGSGIDRETNPSLSIIPLDRIYPILDVEGMNSREAIEQSSKSGLDGAEGFCFFDKEIGHTSELSCVSKYESSNKKTVYSIKMKVQSVTKKANFPEP
jgi:hypothetical protein